MRGFLGALVLTIGGGVGLALLVELAPLPVLRVASTLVLAACVYFAGRGGAPGWPVLSHVFGLAFAVLALGANWAAWLVAISGFDVAAARAQFGVSVETALSNVEALSDAQIVAVGGRILEGDVLVGFWLAGGALILIAGFLGGQSAYLLWRDRRRAARR